MHLAYLQTWDSDYFLMVDIHALHFLHYHDYFFHKDVIYGVDGYFFHKNLIDDEDYMAARLVDDNRNAEEGQQGKAETVVGLGLVELTKVTSHYIPGVAHNYRKAMVVDDPLVQYTIEVAH